MNTTATLFDAGEIVVRPRRESARVKSTVTEEHDHMGRHDREPNEKC